jgi:hypothetical protein
MPKLSQDSLNKRFTCQYCEDTFRTRQGLSGHIQFKHKVQQSQSMDDKYNDISNIIKIAKHLDSVGKAAGLSKARSQGQARIVARWSSVFTVCDVLKLKLNNQDFKNYLIASLACMYENEELEERLINEIRTCLMNIS